jgi:hypothetical protein
MLRSRTALTVCVMTAAAAARGEQTPQAGLELATKLTVRDSTAPPPT